MLLPGRWRQEQHGHAGPAIDPRRAAVL